MPQGQYKLSDAKPIGQYALTDIQPQDANTKADAPSWLDSLKTYASEALSVVDPRKINDTIQQAFYHPIDTAAGILASPAHLMQKAEEAWNQGDKARALTHALNAAIPLIGSRIDQSQDDLLKGNVAKGLGEATDAGLQVSLPGAIDEARSMRVPVVPKTANPNPVMADAVRFADANGIPVDGATATGSSRIANLQKRVSNAVGGAGTAERVQTAQREGLASLGEQLAAKANANGPSVTPDQAGAALQSGVRATVNSHAADADTAYSALRQIESKNVQTVQTGTRTVDTGLMDAQGTPITRTEPVTQDMPAPVDLRTFKAQVQPFYQDLARQAELVPLQGDKARALTALDRIVKGPDYAPASTVDAALGDLKSMARSDIPELRTQGQGIAAKAVSQLSDALDQTVAQMGPDAVQALKDGRAATVAKYQAGDVLDLLMRGNAEPVAGFKMATSPRDAALARLKDLQKQAPDAIPGIARAFLDQSMDYAQRDGGFKNVDGIKRTWEQMGPQTKQILFKDPAYIGDLDKFFRVAQKMTENVNPSGTAGVMTATMRQLTAMPVNYAMSKLLYTRRGVQLLTRGFQLPVGNTVARSLWTSEVSRLLSDSDAMGVPALAGRTDQSDKQ